MSFKEFLRQRQGETIDLTDVIVVLRGGPTYERLEEGKFVQGTFPNSIRIDLPTHLAGNGQPHAHIYARNGNQLGVVNFDGSASHSSKFRLPKRDAKALRDRGFKIPPDRFVEWTVLPPSSRQLREVLGDG